MMHQILDFMRAAAPWAAMGSLLVILAVRGAAEKKRGKRRESDYSMEGMCLGMCLGMCFGTALGNNTVVVEARHAKGSLCISTAD